MSGHLKLILLATKLCSGFCFGSISAVNEGYLKNAKDILENLMETSKVLFPNSCEDHCGENPEVSNKRCSCSALCLVYRNCCADIGTECPEVVTEGMKKFGHMLDLQVECLPMAGALALTSCPNQTHKRLINEDSYFGIINNVPVHDVHTGLVYANIDIFNCNVPNTSNSGLRWKVTVNLIALFPEKPISKIEHFRFLKPFYYSSSAIRGTNRCTPSTVSTCNNSVILQRICQSFVSYQLLQNIVLNYTICGACSINLSAFSTNVTFQETVHLPLATIEPAQSLLRVKHLPWSEAKCDMSRNATLSGPKCQIVKCNSHLSYYLHEDGTCRMFSLLSISFQNDLWLLNQAEYDSLLNYMMNYLSRYVDVNPLSAVKPLCSLYSTQLQQNFSIATFVLDFNSSALEDYVYIKYKDELSILASEIRAIIEYKITQTNISNTDFKLENNVIGQQWKAIQTNKSISDHMVFNWCSCPNLSFSLFTSSENKSLVCLSKLMYLKKADGDTCYELTDDEFRCYDEIFPDSFERKQATSVANVCYGNLLFLIVQPFVLYHIRFHD